MNTIPTIGPDAGIAPRTGSGSPQTPAQQRADTAPTVISDSAASADPGVLLKITPPVLPRNANVDIGERLPPDQMAAYLAQQQLEKQGTIQALGTSAEQADQALAARMAEAFAALPADVQEAIRQASSPAIAQLLKLAAMTASGIKDAPAVIQSSINPLAQQPEDAAGQLLRQMSQADAFKLAAALRSLMGELSASADLEATRTLHSLRPAAAFAQAQSLSQATLGLQQAGAGAMAALLTQGETPPEIPPLAGQGLGNDGPDGAMPIPNQIAAANRVAQAYANPAQGLADAFDALLTAPSGASPSGSGTTGGASAQTPPNAPPSQALVQPSPANPYGITIQQAEQGLREGLKLLMDGRMLWQGQFTPGVPLRLERSDAWQADRHAIGGMDKGTSIRVQLQLPHLGELEIRALGFGGQVSVRVHADPAATPTFAQSLPLLIERLRERGLAGAQVVVDSR